MNKSFFSRAGVAITSLLMIPFSTALAQNAIQLFGPTNVRASQTSGLPATFNSANVNLTCGTSPITAKLSSTADGAGNVLVDNYINVVSLTSNGPSAPVNICTGVSNNSCFNNTYESTARNLVGQDPDNFAATGGIPPIDVSSEISQSVSTGQTTFNLVDGGVLLASSSIYLVTNCTQAGVTGPAKVTGNPISSSNPTNQQLAQDFTFDPTKGQDIGFVYDLTTAQSAGQLNIIDQTIPNTADNPFDPALWPQYATGTSFATSSCLVHNGELLNTQPACKIYTLTCQVGTGASSAGANCPVSQLRNELVQDVFSGPSFTLPDITGPNGHTYHQGVGFLMAQDGWTGGPCVFDPSTGSLNLQDCPQNLLTNFTFQAQAAATLKVPINAARSNGAAPSVTGSKLTANSLRGLPGSNSLDGTVPRPNSTFISVAQVPEDLTTVTVQGAHAGGWINTDNALVTFSSEPPVLPATVANYQNFVPSPIQSITYGWSAANAVPPTTFAVPGDQVLLNPVACPTPAAPTTPPAAVFLPAVQSVSVPSDGQYLIHYFAQDCAGTEELKFVSAGGGFTTTFYTSPLNVDTVPPVVASGPVLSPAPGTVKGVVNSYLVGDIVKATYSCTDNASGVATCADHSYSLPGTLNTGTLSSNVDTSSVGTKTFTVQTTDIAGNTGTPAGVTYNVVGGNADLAELTFARRKIETGANMMYDVLALNFGPATASNVVITDSLPAGTTFVSAGYEDISCAIFSGCSIPSQAASCTTAGNVVTCSPGSLAPLSFYSLSGVAVKIVVTVTAPAGTVLTNLVTVMSDNPDNNLGNNSSTQKTKVTK